MAPHVVIAPEACFIGMRADRNACEADSDHASRIPNHYLQQKNELVTKDKLRQKRILEEVYKRYFPDVPLALPPCHLRIEISCKADSKRVSANIVFSRPIEARDFERHATERGCNFHSPELTVWTELCHVSSAQPAALAWRDILF
jgi:hypothetical protein